MTTRDLFEPLVSQERLHPAFQVLATFDGYQAARHELQEVFDQMPQPDENLVEQFQTTGFDQRVWELALFAGLTDLRFTVRQPGSGPDFVCRYPGGEFLVEATTANAPMQSGRRRTPARTPEEFLERLQVRDVSDDEVAVRFGSALHSKARRSYDKLPEVAGKPLLIAIEAFFDEGSLWRAEVPLLNYLFGRRLTEARLEGEMVFIDHPVESHVGSHKEIPSGFFLQDENQGVAGVIFSNSGTVGKFSRIGYQKGHGMPGVFMHRMGYRFDHDPCAIKPAWFYYEVGTTEERWRDGLLIIHNPNATYPLDRETFAGVSQAWEGERGFLETDIVSNHIFTSATLTLQQPQSP